MQLLYCIYLISLVKSLMATKLIVHGRVFSRVKRSTIIRLLGQQAQAGPLWGALGHGHADVKVGDKESLLKQNELQLCIMDLSGAILRKS